MTTIQLHSIVLMIGPSGAGKSTLANKLFPQHEIISSDAIRAEFCGDFRVQTRNDEIFAEVHRRTEHRLLLGQRVVVDATNLKTRDRQFFINLSQRLGVPLYYLVVNRSIDEKLATAGWRKEVNGLIEKHDNTFQSNLRNILNGDGVATVIQWTQPFSVVNRGDVRDLLRAGHYNKIMAVGDIHGNPVETRLAAAKADAENAFTIYLGDVVDYGEHNLEAFWFVYERVMAGKAVLVWGNHERKLDMWLRANFGATYRGKISNGMMKTVNELKQLGNRQRFGAAWNALESMSRQHYVLGDLLFTHGAATPELWYIKDHRPHGEHGQLAYFGQLDREKPMREDGYPNRVYDWVDKIEPGKTVVVGHDIRDTNEPFVHDNHAGGRAVFLDTGSGKGGKLSYIIYEV